ncbi:MAG TPA: CPBP family intramembrane metalloprotease [Lutibacter sp.]|nr:CPBP family intramembrane metalloprotease [Lutibacter sp.]
MNYIQQAFKGKNEWWRYLLMILLIFFGWQIIGIIPISVVAIMHSSDMIAFQNAAVDSFMNLGINANLYLFSMIMMFAIGLFFIFLGIKSIHKRSITSLLTSRKELDWKRVFFAFGIWFAISMLVLSVDYFSAPENYEWNFNLVPFLILVAISFFLLPLQTSFEEVLFRGYLMQSIGILVKNKWIPLLITSIGFGLLHSFNPEVEKLGNLIMVYYIGTGFLFGITTLMDEGLELSLGLHAANNIVAAVFVTTNWTVFQTDALFIDTSEPSLGMETFVPVFVIYPILLFIFSKKYAWKNWKEKLLGSVEKV